MLLKIVLGIIILCGGLAVVCNILEELYYRGRR